MLNAYVSIIVLTYRQGERTKIAQKCLKALVDNTNYPYELILIDNTWNNRGLSDGRNLGLAMATGGWICIMDDDIYVLPNWLSNCISTLKRTDMHKYLVTPLIQRCIGRWELPNVKEYRCNARTGSNCMIGRREIFEKVGAFANFKDRFPDKRRGMQYEAAKAGKYYSDLLYKAGYLFLLTKEKMAVDLGANTHSYL